MVFTDREGVLIRYNSYDCKWSVTENYLFIDFTYKYPVYDVPTIVGEEETHQTNEFEILNLTNTSLKLQRDSKT